MSSTGGIIGGVVGAVIGFFATGYNPMGAVMGFSIGMGIGGMIDPVQPDIPNPGRPDIDELDFTKCAEGDPLPDFLGTTKITGNIIQVWGERVITLTQEQEVGGKGGGGQSQTVITGYEYHLSWAQAFSYGPDPVDKLLTVLFDGKCVYSGELTDDDSDGEETVELGEFGGDILGSMTFYFGTSNQVANAKAAAALDDPTLASGLRGLCYAVFDDVNIGSFNRCPTVRIVVSKYPSIAALGSDSLALCNCLDYNPAFALYYILENHSELPTARLDSTSFAAAASDFQSSDYVGVSLLLSKQVAAKTYIEGILNHVGAIIIEDEGALVLQRLRDDVAVGNMPAIADINMLDEPMVKVGSWENTYNDIKIAYSYMDCTTYPFQGEFTGQIDLKDYDTVWSNAGQCIHVADDIYAVVWTHNGSVGTLRTYQIAADGTIGASIDSWTFNASTIYSTYIMKVEGSSNIFCITNFYSVRQIFTVQINDDGTIVKSKIDTYNAAGVSGSAPYNICHLTGSAYALLWIVGYYGNVEMIYISATGTFTTGVDSLQYDTVFNTNYDARAFKYTDSILLIPWMRAGSPNYKVMLTSITFTAGGFVSQPDTITVETLSGYGYSGSLSICSGVYKGFNGIVLGYSQASHESICTTVAVDAVGNLTVKDRKVMDAAPEGGMTAVIPTTLGKGFIFCGSDETDGITRYFEIDSDGNIGDDIDTFIFPAYNDIEIIPNANNDSGYISVVKWYDNDGTWRTFGIN